MVSAQPLKVLAPIVVQTCTLSVYMVDDDGWSWRRYAISQAVTAKRLIVKDFLPNAPPAGVVRRVKPSTLSFFAHIDWFTESISFRISILVALVSETTTPVM